MILTEFLNRALNRALCRGLRRSCLLLALVSITALARGADDFDEFLKPLFAENCVKCHGKKRVKGKINLGEIKTAEDFLAKSALIQKIIKVIDASDMPPEDESELSEKDRGRLLANLRVMLRNSTSGNPARQIPIRRLNRFQYNNSVVDLFRLKSDVFRLPEKLMTRHGAYLNSESGKMPDRVEVACLSLKMAEDGKDGSGLRGVSAYPKDLRAAQGFDNQANQLTLSPLLLDAFLKLGVSIVESPDFNERSVGIWNDFFSEPAPDADPGAEVMEKLGAFLRIAFRGAVDDETLNRYTAYAMSKIRQGMSFTDSMKKVAAAALSSPMFLYRYERAQGLNDQFTLASNLSFFLWGTSPNAELLDLAERGELRKPEVLVKTLERMLADPKIERFLDAFPAQWMQLENILAATPDPRKQRFFHLDRSNPASLQMVLEPLLLFDAVFIEDRPIVELIAPTFGYRSDFLRTWYESNLKPPELDRAEIARENRARKEQLEVLEMNIKMVRAELEALGRTLPDLISMKLETVDLSTGQAKWEAAQAKLVADGVAYSIWHRIGPFTASNLDEAHSKAFLDETAVDVRKTQGKMKWTEAKNFVDGKVHMLRGANSATYLYRTIQSGSARPLDVSLGSDDSFKIWLNGKLVADKKVSRGVAPDQDQLQLELIKGENSLLMKVANGGGGYGFYFKAQTSTLPGPVLAALQVETDDRNAEQKNTLAKHYIAIAPELAPLRKKHAETMAALRKTLKESEVALERTPKTQDLKTLQQGALRKYDNEIRNQLRSRVFKRVDASDPRYGGVITNAAMLSMTSGPRRTLPIARGAWILEVILNDPPQPPPNDVPPLNEDEGPENLTIREKFARHRENPDCAGCHSKLDPLGFALENFDITGRWRDKYENGRTVDASGTLLKKYAFEGIVQFKESLVKEERRFARAFTGHLLRFALSRELGPADSLTIDEIVDKTESENFKLRSIIREVVLSDSFLQAN